LKPGVLPQNLKILYIGDYFNKLLEADVLPNGLTELYFKYYTQPLENGVLPSKLTILDLGYYFIHPIAVGVLLDSLKKFSLGGRRLMENQNIPKDCKFV